MAHPLDHRGWRSRTGTGTVRNVLLLLGFILILYLVKPPFISRNTSNGLLSCLPCFCDCSLDSESLLSMPVDVVNSSFADCGKGDPEIYEEMQKDTVALLSEEIGLQKNVTSDSLEHTKSSIMDAKRTSSHYQREGEKCNSAMETCEEARERAQLLFIEERKLSQIWEIRAREVGWDE